MTLALILFVLGGVVAFAVTAVARRYALAHAMIDVPTHRSSHDRPVPRGGGVGIVSAVVAAVVLLSALNVVSMGLLAAVVGGGGAVALIGWLDDRLGGVNPLVRLVVHAAAGLWAVAWVGGIDRLAMGPLAFNLGSAAGALIGALGIIWSVNLFNFMDGIDGLAGSETALVGASAALLIGVTGGETAVVLLSTALAGAALGFLVWNWPPARIFMGDVGSGFLGFIFALLAISSERSESAPLLLWLLLGGVFVFDSTVTLIRRVIARERWHLPHRSHAYQRLVAKGYSHAAVTAAVCVLNVALAAIAWASFVMTDRLNLGALAALALLTLAYLVVERIQPMVKQVRAEPDARVESSARQIK